jgi:hypothetical protein
MDVAETAAHGKSLKASDHWDVRLEYGGKFASDFSRITAR